MYQPRPSGAAESLALAPAEGAAEYLALANSPRSETLADPCSLGRRLIQPRVLLTGSFTASSRTAKEQHLLQVFAVHHGAENEQHASREHAYCPPSPRVAPYQGGGHA